MDKKKALLASVLSAATALNTIPIQVYAQTEELPQETVVEQTETLQKDETLGADVENTPENSTDIENESTPKDNENDLPEEVVTKTEEQNRINQEEGPTIIDKDTVWDSQVVLNNDLIVHSGVTLTIRDQITVEGSVTISGGGTIKSDSSIPSHVYEVSGKTEEFNNMILVAKDSHLNLENITVDGGAQWGDSQTEESVILGHDLNNRGIQRTGTRAAMVQGLEGSVLNIANNAILQNNDAPTSAGAAVRSDSGFMYISDGAVIQNNRASSGAVLQLFGKLFMSGGLIQGNVAADSNGQGGGGLRTQAEAEITGGIIRNNISLINGGGIAITWNEENLVSIKNVEISNNKAVLGGAIYVTYNSSPDFKTVLENVVLSGNYAESGAGLSADSAKVKMNDVRFVDNEALRGAGISGIGAFYFNDCTMTGNKAYAAPAIHFLGDYGFFGGNTTIKNNEVLKGDIESESPYNGEAQVLVGPKGVMLTSPITGEGIEDVDFIDNSTLTDAVISGEDQYVPSIEDVNKISFVPRFYQDQDGKEYGIFEGIDDKYYRYEATTINLVSNQEENNETQVHKFPLNHEYSLPKNTFVNPNHVFMGWNTKSDGSGDFYEDGQKIDTSEELTLYAQWGKAVAQIGEKQYSSLQDAFNNASDNETIQLLDDIKLSKTLDVIGNKNVTLDLNGFELSLDAPKTVLMNVGIKAGGDTSSLLLTDSSDNKGRLISYSSAFAICVRASASMTTKNVNIEFKENTEKVYGAIQVQGHLLVDEGTNIVSTDSCISVLGKQGVLDLKDGTLQAGNTAITGNESDGYEGTVINISGGSISSDNLGIYHPQNGTLNITDGTVIGGKTGIEIRSGELNISDNAVIKGNGTEIVTNPNGSGSTTDGVGISVAQHTTTHPIKVNITGGTISGYTAFYESNPQENNPLEGISLNISGGTFNAINGGTKAIYSQDCKGFVSGGTFNVKFEDKDEKYIKEGYKFTESNGTYTVEEDKTSRGNIARAYLNSTNNRIYADLMSVYFNESVKIQLFSKDVLLTEATLVNPDIKPGYHTELSSSFTLKEPSSSWSQKDWTPTHELVPTMIKLIVDGKEVASVDEIYTGSADLGHLMKAEDWYQFEGTQCVFSEDWKTTSKKHWKECVCGKKDQEADHVFVNGRCDCGYEAAAIIGDTYYGTLADAIENVGDGQTITLVKDVDDAEGISVASGKNFVVDFNKHSYVVAGPGAGSTNTETNAFQLLRDSNITFRNGTISVIENSSANEVKRIIQNYANLTLENMIINTENLGPNENYALSFNYGDIVFKGNTSIISSSSDIIAFDFYNYSDGGYPNGSLTFDESYTGEITGRIIYDSPTADTHKLTIHGNGTFGAIEAASRATEAAKDGINITGGTFLSKVDKEYLAKGTKLVENEDGTFSVEEIMYAAIGDTQYSSLEKAVEAAQPGDVIQVLENVELDETLVINKSVTLDLQEKTVKGQVIIDNPNAEVTITNGTLSHDGQKEVDATLLVQSGKAILTDSLKVEATANEGSFGTGKSAAIAVYGLLEANGTTVNGNDWGIIAYNSCQVDLSNMTVHTGGNPISTAAAYSNPDMKVTIHSGEYKCIAPTGNWSYSAIYWASHGTLTIEGGEFTSAVKDSNGLASTSLYAKNGTVNISGGEFVGSRDGIKIASEDSDSTEISINITGGTFEGGRSGIYVKTDGDGAAHGKYSVNVKGGTFAGEEYSFYGSCNDKLVPVVDFDNGSFDGVLKVSNNLKDFVNGGEFSDKQVINYLAEGKATLYGDVEHLDKEKGYTIQNEEDAKNNATTKVEVNGTTIYVEDEEYVEDLGDDFKDQELIPEEIVVSYENLKNTISLVEKYDQEVYKKSTWDIFEKALTAAKEMVEVASGYTQNEVNTMADQLQEAAEGLVEKEDTQITVEESLGGTYTGKEIEFDESQIKVVGSTGVLEYKFVQMVKSNEDVKKPINVGSYTLNITVAADDNYKAATLEVPFEIKKATNEFSVSLDNWSYNQEPKQPVIENLKFGNAEDIQFTYSTEENGPYSSTVPTEGGYYFVKAYLKGTENYSDATAISEFAITSSETDFSVSTDKEKYEYGDIIQFKIKVKPKENTLQRITISNTVEILFNENLVTKGEITENEELTLSVDTTQLKDLGELDRKIPFTIAYSGSENLKPQVKDIGVILNKATNEFTKPVSIEDITFGQTVNPSAEAKYGTVEFTYSTEEDGEFTSEKPTDAGTYYVKAEVKEAEHYTGLSEVQKFTISKAETSIQFTKDLNKEYDGLPVIVNTEDIQVGNTNEPVLSFWKASNAKERIEGPVDAGNYKLEIKVEADKNHQEEVLEVPFTITKAKNEWTSELSVEDVDYNQSLKVNATSKYGTVQYLYSQSQDGPFTDTKPKDVGTYYVKAMVEDTENYSGLESKVASFEIKKASLNDQQQVEADKKFDEGIKQLYPKGIQAKVGQTLSELVLPEGFVWKYPNMILDDTGSQTFEVVYILDETNYLPFSISIDVTVYPSTEVINQIPTIKANDVTLTVGEAFDPMKDVTASDKEDGDLTSKIEVENNVDTSKAGTYKATYKVTDSQGATATKTITVTVNPKMEGLNEVPTIKANDVTLTVGDAFDPMKGVTASDKEDGDLTSKIEVEDNVDTSKAGTYKVTYSVTDKDGASVTKTITVTVKEKEGTPVTPDQEPEKPSTQDGENTGLETQAGLISTTMMLSVVAGIILLVLKKRETM